MKKNNEKIGSLHLSVATSNKYKIHVLKKSGSLDATCSDLLPCKKITLD